MVSTLILQTHQGIVRKQTILQRKGIFSGLLCSIEKLDRDRLCDDDMEPNSDSHQNRWREMGKEHSDMNKIERHYDESRHFLDRHRGPQDRWGSSPCKEGNLDQRRDNRWNFRWGPTGKGSENWRDKSTDSGKQNDASREKGFSHNTSHGKDGNNPEKETERDGYISRSWKSSYLTSHDTGGTSDHLSHAPQKSPPSFGYSRGRQESENLGFSSSHRSFTSGTSRVSSGSSRPLHLGILSDHPGGASRDSVPYSRMKLLEIYRTTDVRNFVMPIDDTEISSLWQEDPVQPLALIAPNAEEAEILKGIDKGDITNSGVQACKDSSVGKGNPDVVPSEQSKLGGREDQAGSNGDFKGEMTENNRGPGDAELSEPLKPDKSTYAAPQESESIGERIHGSTAEFRQHYNVLDQGSKVSKLVGVGDIVRPVQPHPENLSLYYC